MHLRQIILGAGLAALAVGSAQACPDHAAKTAVITSPHRVAASTLVAWKPRAWSPVSGSTVASQGLRVSIDPVDGAMGMPAVDETPQVMVPGEDAPVSVTRRGDGSVRAALDERFADFAVVSMGADGKPHWTCVHGSAEAAKFVSTPKPASLQPAMPPAPDTVWEEK